MGDVFKPDPPKTPPPPDYRGAAQAESAGGAQAALASNVMAHPNIYTPLGSQTWNTTGSYQVPSIGGNPGFSIPTYQQNVNLSTEGQGLFDEQMRLSQGLLGLGNTSLGQVEHAVRSGFKPGDIQMNLDPMNFDRTRAEQSVYDRAASRLDPQWQQRENMQKVQLANQGLVPGGEAYDDAMRNLNMARNDAYSSAMNDAIRFGGDEMSRQFGIRQGQGAFANQAQQQAFQQAAYDRGLPLTEFNAIRTGAQPQMPTFQPVQYAGMQGPNLLQAAGLQGNYNQNLYNQQLGANNAFMGGLFDLGAAGLGAAGAAGGFGALFSDRRLKSNISRIGTHPLGIGIYAYRIFGKDTVGVMADEVLTVKPEAVVIAPNGYLMVNYGLL